MNKFGYVFIFFLIFINCINNVSADEGENTKIFFGIKSRLYYWNISIMEQITLKTNAVCITSDPSTIAEVKSDMGHSLGPEIEYYNKGFFLRVFYLFGEYDFFKKGKANRKDIGVDIGYKKLFKELTVIADIGYRYMDVSVKFNDTNLKDHYISDVVLGTILRLRSNKPGFTANFEVLLGVRGIIDQLSNIGSTDERLKETLIGNMEFDVGYRFKIIPLTINIGYGVWGYYKPIKEYTEPALIDKLVTEYWSNDSHGPTIKIVFSF